MRVAFALACFVFATLTVTKSHALPGTELYRSCHSKEGSVGDFACVAYIHGFLDGLITGRMAGKQNPAILCPPKDGISVDQSRLIVEKYMRDHPDELNKETGLVAASAMLDAFPCRAKSN